MQGNSRSRRRLFVPACIAAAVMLAGSAASAQDAGGGSGDDGTVLVEDSFVDDSNGWGGGQSDPPGYWSVAVDEANQVLAFDITQDPDADDVPAPEFFPDSLLEREADLEDQGVFVDVSWGGSSVPVVLCRTNADDFRAYGFAVRPNGSAVIVERSKKGRLEVLAESADGEEVFDVEAVKTSPLNIGALCATAAKGAVRLTMWLDGERVLRVVDRDGPNPKTGIPGLNALQWAGRDEFTPDRLQWDDFEVVEYE
jgi:hypothetical protein